MAVTMTTVATAQTKAGAGINAVMLANAGSEVDGFIEEAEAFLCNLTKYDLITNWGTLNAVYKLMFSEYAGRSAAVEIVSYDMKSYIDRVEAEDIINVHIYRMNVIIKTLEDASVQDFMAV